MTTDKQAESWMGSGSPARLAELMQPAEPLLDAVNLRGAFLAIPGCGADGDRML